jgi:hypothetical protein
MFIFIILHDLQSLAGGRFQDIVQFMRIHQETEATSELGRTEKTFAQATLLERSKDALSAKICAGMVVISLGFLFVFGGAGWSFTDRVSTTESTLLLIEGAGLSADGSGPGIFPLLHKGYARRNQSVESSPSGLWRSRTCIMVF